MGEAEQLLNEEPLSFILPSTKKRLHQRTALSNHGNALVDLMTLKPALGRLQNKPNVVARRKHGIGVIRLKIVNFLYDTFRINVSGREWPGTILHPKGSPLRVRQWENHSGILGEIRAKHHAGALLLW